jgi:hypothetical protein
MFRIFKNSGSSSGANGEEYMVITPIVQNGYVGKRLPKGVLIKNILVKGTVLTPSFQFGTVANGNDLCYETLLPAFKPQSFVPFAFTENVTSLFVSGYVAGVITIVIIYQKINI